MTAPPQKIDLIVYDFDGVMTDNRVLVSEHGDEAVFANRGDGWGVHLLRSRGIPQLILSTEANPVVSARAKKLKLPCIQNCEAKAPALIDYCQQHSYDQECTVYVGNDTNDLEAMQWVGWPVAPSDAHPSILQLAKHVTRAAGGYGVVRELADWLLSERG